MQHAREMNRESIHCIFLAPSAGTGVGGEQRKGSRDSKIPPPPFLSRSAQSLKAVWLWLNQPFQNEELKVSTASSDYHAMLWGDKGQVPISSPSPSLRLRI